MAGGLRGEHAEALAAFEDILADISGALTDFDRAVVPHLFWIRFIAGMRLRGNHRRPRSRHEQSRPVDIYDQCVGNYELSRRAQLDAAEGTRRDYQAAYLALLAAEAVIAQQPLVESEAHAGGDYLRRGLQQVHAANPATQRRAFARLQQVHALLHLHDGQPKQSQNVARA